MLNYSYIVDSQDSHNFKKFITINKTILQFQRREIAF